MIMVCDQFAADFDMKFNSGKSVVLRIGNSVPFTLNREVLKFVGELKYLGVYLVAGKYFRTTIDHLKVNLCRVFNCIFAHSKAANSEMVSVELI